jgi:hypothetical protein
MQRYATKYASSGIDGADTNLLFPKARLGKRYERAQES